MKKNIRTRINDIRVKRKIMLFFVIGVVVPTLGLLSVFMGQILSEFTQREEAEVQGELTGFQSNINMTIETAKQLAATYFADENLAWALETYSAEDKSDLEILRGIDEQVLQHLTIHPFIQNICIYYENPQVFETFYAKLLSADVTKEDWYQKFLTKGESSYIGVDLEDTDSHIYLVRNLNVEKYESNNIIKIDLSTRWLKKSFMTSNSGVSQRMVYLVDPSDQIVVTNDTDASGGMERIRSNQKVYIYEQSFEAGSQMEGWKVAISYDKSEIQKSLYKKIMILGGSFALTFGLSLAMFYILAHTLILRLERLAKVMDRADENNLHTLDFDMGKDEIGITANSYNRMVHRIQSLIRDNVKANQELKATNEALKTSLQQVEQQNQEIYSLVYTDRLTDLYNRFGTTTYIDRLIKDAAEGERFAIGFLDIDNFKMINDTYGHDIGDMIIKNFGKRLKEFENEQIRIGRFGGDEFVIIIGAFQDQDALWHKLNLIQDSLKSPIAHGKITFALTVSIGVSIYGLHSFSRHELITLADIALYKAKDMGRDRVVIFENDMHQQIILKSQQQELIKKAIQENQFLLHYQPYFDAHTQQMKGCEALLRWSSDCHLKMSPYEVIRHIEEMGLMVEFGKWIIREACEFAKKLNQGIRNPLNVSINISSIQLTSYHFAEDIQEILQEVGVETQLISLEMTESILMSSLESGTKVIRTLREQGIAIYLDDFGTGYSSLGYFKELPISTLKIDKSFIDQICNNQYDAELVETIIQLAHNKDVNVIAEGIEDSDQYELLKSMSCDLIQGYYFSRPVSSQEILKMVHIMEGKA